MLTILALALQAAAQPRSDAGQIFDRGGQIAARPATDIGARKTEIPPVLQRAAVNPYARAGTATCSQLRSQLASLSAALGPDFRAGANTQENRAGKLAEAGGKTLVNGLVPFRGLVREISGAAPAERRLNAAISAGHARRGFLRGMAAARNCRV